MVRALRDDMRENKTIDFLMENAHVEEISSDEFLKRYWGQDQGQEADSAVRRQWQRTPIPTG